jgi:hypothetical protein
MKNKIKEWINWLVFAGWYKGGDMGDGILVSLISGAVFIFGGAILVGYIVCSLYSYLF